ncbi:hypothetical protein OOU_Y34scaffold00273g2 [Pyricularia oryzae Y34]|uniref:Uncharacterized protein n=1 Tax=Pyricularia oryzae (strain Y34) TaxID=1143189 RepID=A0AA97P3Y8_PYRO3|nr:hypothetical protein OOU_Y34scaffold00273g2 [Pyricularia oryzae Y34]
MLIYNNYKELDLNVSSMELQTPPPF